MDGRNKPKSAKWYAAIRRANRARRGKKRAFSPKRSATMKLRWKDKTYKNINLQVITKRELRKMGLIDCHNKVTQRKAA